MEKGKYASTQIIVAGIDTRGMLNYSFKPVGSPEGIE